MKTLILCTILSSHVVVLAQTNAQYEGNFLFTNSYGDSLTLIYGFDPYATDGLDQDLGEVITPQVPADQFGVRFQLPTDTSQYSIKDIRYGCGQIYYYQYLIDLSYGTAFSINIDWEWEGSFVYEMELINPYNNQTLETLSSFLDTPHYEIQSLDKIIIGIYYSVPLSWPEYYLYSPNSGEFIESGKMYTLRFWGNQLEPFMNIEFSSDAGETWDYIVQSFLNTQNSYNWIVPSINSDHCLIRIGDYPCAYDESIGTFVIYMNNPPELNAVEVPFYITNSTNDSVNLIAGIHPFATNNLDTSLGENNIQFPPAGELAAAMIINDDSLSLKDYLPGYSTYIGTKKYPIMVQPETDSIVFLKMTLPSGIIPSLTIIREGPNGLSFMDTILSTNEINFQFPAGTYYGGWGTLPGIKLTLTFDGTIPVELNLFTAYVSGNTVTLNWSTATETNNRGFEIERNKLFKGNNPNEWERISFIEGYGTTTEPHSYFYIDKSLKPEKYQFRLKQIDFDGSFEYSQIVEADIGVPNEFSLLQNYPNPFNPNTKIKFTIPKKSLVNLNVYDILGNKVRTLVNQIKQAGEYEIEFDGKDLPSGVYFYQITAGDFNQTKKMILMK